MNRFLLLLVLSICSSARCQSSSPDLPQRLERLVNARLEATRCPGLSVAGASQNVTLTTASVQRLASPSKPITGSIIMDLVEQGKLSLDLSVRQGVSP